MGIENAAQWGLGDSAAALARGECSSVELTTLLLQRIKRLDGELNSFITLAEEQALAAAAAADARRHKGEAGPLTGVPIAHKDLFCSKDMPTTCGSRLLADYQAPYDATVVARARQAGMVMLGKTNMDEFAMGASNENSHFGPVRNPWDLLRVPGGSSGGSAAAVAARLVAAATGSDTGGSIRLPAAFCGITGIKPSYGRVSRYGMVAFASSLDQGGVLARSAQDCALLLQLIVGFDSADSTAMDCPVPDYSAALERPVKGLRIGLPSAFFEHLDGAQQALLEQALAVLASQGIHSEAVSLPNLSLSVPAYYVIATAEASSNLARYDGIRYGQRATADDLESVYRRSRSLGFGAEVKRRIMTGSYVLSTGYYDAYYRQAQRVRRVLRDDFLRVFEHVDVIAAPTAAGVAFGLGERMRDPVAMYRTDTYTTAANLVGLPALSMPVGCIDGLPLGMQLIAPHFAEERLLQLAHHYQNLSDHHRQQPDYI